MSSENEKPILFGNIFALFYLYWNYNRDRMQQNSVYLKLSSIYQKNKWNLRELDWACSVINYGLECVNPYQFMNRQYPYLGHIQNLFYIINI